MSKPLKLVGHCDSCNSIIMTTKAGSKSLWKEYSLVKFCKHCRTKEGEGGKMGHFKIKLKIHKGKSN